MSALAAGLLVIALGQTPYSEAVSKTPGLTGYWRFEERSTAEGAHDSAGTDDALYTPSLALGVDGFQGPDGGTGFSVTTPVQVVNIPAPPALEVTPATAEFWIRVDAPGDTTVNRSVFRQTSADGGRHWYFGFSPGSDATRMTFSFQTDSAHFRQVQSQGPLSQHQWHLIHLVLGQHLLALHVDGNLIAHSDPDLLPPALTENMYLGTVTSGAYSFDELAIYDRALTDEEIAARFRLGKGLPPEDAGSGVSIRVPPNAFTFGCGAAPGAASGAAFTALGLGLRASRRRRRTPRS